MFTAGKYVDSEIKLALKLFSAEREINICVTIGEEEKSHGKNKGAKNNYRLSRSPRTPRFLITDFITPAAGEAFLY